MSNLDALLVWLNSGVCSQNPAHSFWIGGRPLPVCARDLGLFGALLLALPLARHCPAHGRLWWLLGILPLVLDGANSFAAEVVGMALYAPSNVLRLATGGMAGISLAFLLSYRTPFNLSALWFLAPALGAIMFAGPWMMVAVLGTTGVLALLSLANQLVRPALQPNLGLLLALPELAALALIKQALVAWVR